MNASSTTGASHRLSAETTRPTSARGTPVSSTARDAAQVRAAFPDAGTQPNHPMADEAPGARVAAPRGCVCWEKAYPGSPATVSRARHDVRAILGPCPEAVADDAELVVSELAANAIRHSRSGARGGTYLVRITHCATEKVPCIWIEVHDQGNPSWDGTLRKEPMHGLSVIGQLCTWMGSDDDREGQRAVYARLDYRADGTRLA
jgi:anti-sigma regulatory factor (Ser/Thr protein kinase)